MDQVRKIVKNIIKEIFINDSVIFSGIDDKTEAIMDDIRKISSEKGNELQLSDFIDIGKKHDIEFVDYPTFYQELPEDWKKSDIPKPGYFFGLLNTNTGKARVVIPSGNFKMNDKDFDYIKLIISHELVHVGQGDRMGGIAGGNLLNKYKPVKTVFDKTHYYSDKNENMAWAKTSVDQFIERNKDFVLENSGDMKLIFNKFYKGTGFFESVKNALKTQDKEAWKKFLKNVYNYMNQKVEWLVNVSKK